MEWVWVVMDDDFIAYKYKILSINHTRAHRFCVLVYRLSILICSNLPIQTSEKRNIFYLRLS